MVTFIFVTLSLIVRRINLFGISLVLCSIRGIFIILRIFVSRWKLIFGVLLYKSCVVLIVIVRLSTLVSSIKRLVFCGSVRNVFSALTFMLFLISFRRFSFVFTL